MSKLSRWSAAVRTSGVMTLTAAAGTIAVLTAGAPAAAEPVVQPPCFEAVPAAADALALAKRCDRRVEVTSQRTEFAQVFANPAGTLMAERRSTRGGSNNRTAPGLAST